MTITLPPDLGHKVALAAQSAGTTPDQYAISALREKVEPMPVEASPAEGSPPGEGSLYDLLVPYIGQVSGDGTAWSQDTGKRFTDILVEQRERERERK